MAINLPRRIARFNRVVTNRIQGQYAWLLPPWAIVRHRGRRSGKAYRTPVTAFRRGQMLAIPVLYGERSDWIQNVLAGEAQVIRAGRTYELGKPRLVNPRKEGYISPLGRLVGRASGKVLIAELSDPRPGFGRGPRAG